VGVWDDCHAAQPADVNVILEVWKNTLELTLTLEIPQNRILMFGEADANLRMLRQVCNVRVTARDGVITLSGKKKAVSQAAGVIESMQRHVQSGGQVTAEHMKDIIAQVRMSRQAETENSDPYNVSVFVPSRAIQARTEGQREYLDAIINHDLVFCTGPAGTGKTYLAVAMAVSLLKQKRIRRIVLARPAVEAGEKLGFLPGDLQAKVNPYLRPLFDALEDMMDYSQVKRFLFNDVIEVIPLAFMRGRTLNESVVILDEAQNTTVGQMLMFLTRLGHDSKMIVTGDDSQVDLEDPRKSGLIDAMRRLAGISGIAMVRLTEVDIVRHRLVQNVIKAYNDQERREGEKPAM
jgi:phosphate starvation-inducible protein PhoH and related proteins